MQSSSGWVEGCSKPWLEDESCNGSLAKKLEKHSKHDRSFVWEGPGRPRASRARQNGHWLICAHFFLEAFDMDRQGAKRGRSLRKDRLVVLAPADSQALVRFDSPTRTALTALGTKGCTCTYKPSAEKYLPEATNCSCATSPPPPRSGRAKARLRASPVHS